MNTTYKQINKSERGFTIIEVVLVLAIAGLIFLMVFLALPALQRGQRDAQRRDDASRVVSQLTSFKTNNKGSLPTHAQFISSSFLDGYLKASDGEFNDPQSGATYAVVADAVAGNAALAVGQIQYKRNASCNGEDATGSGGVRQAAIRIKLEGSGHFCQNAS